MKKEEKQKQILHENGPIMFEWVRTDDLIFLSWHYPKGSWMLRVKGLPSLPQEGISVGDELETCKVIRLSLGTLGSWSMEWKEDFSLVFKRMVANLFRADFFFFSDNLWYFII